MNNLADLKLLAENGLMIVEYGADEILETDRLNCIRKMNYGHTTAVSIFKKKTPKNLTAKVPPI